MRSKKELQCICKSGTTFAYQNATDPSNKSGRQAPRKVSADGEPSQKEGGSFMRNGVIIDEKDNVVVAIHELEAGTDVAYPLPGGGEGHVVTREHIPLFHKIARTDIKRGEKVMKYGEYIGVATADIAAGEHVHTHNCASSDDLKDTDANDVASAASDAISPVASPKSTRTFRGYRRADGQVGIRNHVLVLPTSICASDTTERIARAVTGCVTFHNQNGCSQVNVDQQLTVDTLAGLAANPNVYAVLAVSLGCEGCQNDLVIDAIRKRCDKPIRSLIIQKVGGSIKAVEEGTRIARELVRAASLCEREDVPVSELIFGTNCGGSDTSSGLGSNPLIGEVSDWMVSQGATTVLCETPELFGGEHILARRASTPEVSEQILKIVRDYERYVQMFGAEMREGNPSPGNMAGGLTTLEEKSLGCIHKAGHSPINAVYPYAAKLKSHEGLVIMDTPGNDPASVAAMVAGGAQVIVFSSGRGSPVGHPIVPVVKITGNKLTFAAMEDNIDFSAAPLIYGEKTVEELGEDLLKMVIETACGKQTKAEALGFVETAIARICNYV